MTNYTKKFNKYKNSVLPIFFYNEDSMEYIMFDDFIDKKGKNKRLAFKYDNLTECLCDVIKDNFYYGFNTLVEEENDDGTLELKIKHSHAHDFDSVVQQLYFNPKEFSIDEEDKILYSNQEYDYLMRLKSYLITIERKNVTFNDELDDINKLGLEEKAIEYSNYIIKSFDNDSTARNIISKKRNYIITPKYNKKSSLLNRRLLIIDNNSQILGLVEVIKVKSKKIEDLTADDVDFKLDGFKTINAYKKSLKSDLATNCCKDDDIKEVYINQLKIVKKFNI